MDQQEIPENAASAAKSIQIANIDASDLPPETDIDWSSVEINGFDTCDTKEGEFKAKGTVLADIPYIDSDREDRQALALTVYLETSHTGFAFATGGSVEYV